MNKKNWDIIVVGGGIAGLTITSILSKLKKKVLCIEMDMPSTNDQNPKADMRSTAYLLKSIEVFKQAKVWDELESYGQELKVMSIAEASSLAGEIRQISNFNSSELDLPNFGYNIPNWRTKRILIADIKKSNYSKILFGLRVTDLIVQIDKSVVTLSNDIKISAKLVIAADGKNSPIRDLCGIKIKKSDSGQDAIAFVTAHSKPHKGKSIEIFESGGPCTLVPMKSNGNNLFQSAVVWMETRDKSKKLMMLDEKEFSNRLSERTKYTLGNCQLSSRRTLYPIVTQLAENFYGDRVALIAESAHVMPPIGAQGLNTSFEDIDLLVKLLNQAIEIKADFGSQSLLKEYSKIRRKVVLTRMIGIELLNKTSMSNLQIIKDLRSVSLKIIDESSLLKKFLMKTGLGKFN